MDNEQRKLFRTRMAQNRFAPNPSLSAEAQQIEALNHIAFFLDQIESHLSELTILANAVVKK